MLGPITIGNNVRIAAGAVVLSEIPDDCTAVGVPRGLSAGTAPLMELDQVHIPDPVAQELCRLEYRIGQLEQALEKQKFPFRRSRRNRPG